MISFSASLVGDLAQISSWIESDPYHSVQEPEWWLTGSECLLAGCVKDEEGTVLYFRFDQDGPYARMHTQFAPEDQVSKKRVALAIIQGIVSIIPYLKDKGAQGIVYESTSPSLIEFMGKKGFSPRPGGKEFLDEYVLKF